MVELLAAMTMLSVGILAVFAMFESGIIQIKRASTVTTAAALADSEMEKFRAIKFTGIGFTDTDANQIVDGADATYRADPAYRAISIPANGTNSSVVLASTTKFPIQNLNGADGKPYRVDTFITWQPVQNSSGTAGRNVKLVTIVVRDTASGRVYARVASSFDESTGL